MMKKITLLKWSAICVAAFGMNLSMSAQITMSGAGTPSDPYQITSPEHLAEVNKDLSAHYKVMNTIDMKDVTYTGIGAFATPFAGEFDGNGQIINNLNLKGAMWTGMFNYIKGATIKNVYLKNASLIASGNCCGILVGQVDGGTIYNCSVQGTATGSGQSYIGGLVGRFFKDNGGSIKDCNVDVNLSAYAAVGVIIGQAEDKGSIVRCIGKGNVACALRGGGLIGYSGDDGSLPNPTNEFSSNLYLSGQITKTVAWSGADHFNRIIGTFNPGTLLNNLSGEDVTFVGIDGRVVNSDLNSKDGLTKTAAELKNKATYEAIGYKFGSDEANPWTMGKEGYPVLGFESDKLSSESIVSGNNDADVYPNPVQDILNVKGIENVQSLAIYSLNGTLCKTALSFPVSVAGLSQGTYILTIATGDKVINKQFIKY